MKNKKFFYLQYDKINWENQEKTKINSFVNDYIIDKIILKKKGEKIKVFDIGFGIGFFMRMLYPKLTKHYKDIILEGCDPSDKNYKYFIKNKPLIIKKDTKSKIYNQTFQEVQTKEKFDFITAIYVFPHFSSDDFKKIAKKINHLLEKKGQFILVVANEKYLEKKLKTKKDLFIEENLVNFNGREYKEVLHYSDIPQIGKVIDYNRKEKFYIDLFELTKFKLINKKELNDNGFFCTIFVFEKI